MPVKLTSQTDSALVTELEGAILSEIQHRGNDTAFQVRRAFQTSPSIEWSGSAGAIYPAIKRLREQGLIHGEATHDGRSTVRLSLTAGGKAAVIAWACDSERSSSVGIDPFRLRSGIWALLPDDRRRSALQAAAAAIRDNVAFLRNYQARLDEVEAARVELSLRVQAVRLDWISEKLAARDA
jgi:DNA-binding PadR family transcriptional regulator